MFDWKKPTSQMLGRWQPWHKGHTELFKKALKLSGQVCIMFRDVSGVDAGVDGQSDNPFEFEDVKLVQRHRRINELLKFELENGVHALSLHLFTNNEWKDKEEYVKDSPPCAK